MSDGGIIGGLPLSQYQFGPRDDSHLIKPVGQLSGRSVSAFQPSDNYVTVDKESPFYKRAEAFYKKAMTARAVEVAPDVEKKLPEHAPKKTEKPPAVVTTAVLEPAVATASLKRVYTTEVTADLKSFIAELSMDINKFENIFLKADGKKLKEIRPKMPESLRKRSFEDIAKMVKSLKASSQAFGGRNSLSNDVLIGFDKVANYQNQGIPPSYLKMGQKVADKEEVIIAIRPVEKICRTLIEEGYASKGLKIKGKSANWGPQAGFIPVNQALSKLATAPPEKIDKFNRVNQETIFVKHHAEQEHLHISGTRIKELEGMGMLNNVVDVSPAEGYSRAIAFDSAPKGGESQRFEAHQREDGQWDVFTMGETGREPLMVIPVTADFDLLFVHSHYEDVDLGTHDRKQAFDAELGIVSGRKKEIIDALNTQFDRGENKNMVHHGADTENPVTDMDANLPATVFIPKSMQDKMGIYSDSPILVKNEQELARLYRSMRDNGIRVETNELWGELSKVKLEAFNAKVSRFENPSQSQKPGK